MTVSAVSVHLRTLQVELSWGPSPFDARTVSLDFTAARLWKAAEPVGLKLAIRLQPEVLHFVTQEQETTAGVLTFRCGGDIDLSATSS